VVRDPGSGIRSISVEASLEAGSWELEAGSWELEADSILSRIVTFVYVIAFV